MTKPFLNFGAFMVIPCKFMTPKLVTKQIRFPKSKKKRIRNKWANRLSNYKTTQVHEAIVMGNNVYMSPDNFHKLQIEKGVSNG